MKKPTYRIDENGCIVIEEPVKKINRKVVPEEAPEIPVSYDKKKELKQLKEEVKKNLKKAKSVAEVSALIKPMLKMSVSKWREI